MSGSTTTGSSSSSITEDELVRTLFTIRPIHGHMLSNTVTDCFLPVPSMVKVCTEAAKMKMLKGYRSPLEALANSLKILDLRMRFNPDIMGPYLIATETYVNRHTVELYINRLSPEHRLRFLNEAKLQESPLCLLKSAKSIQSRKLALRS